MSATGSLMKMLAEFHAYTGAPARDVFVAPDFYRALLKENEPVTRMAIIASVADEREPACRMLINGVTRVVVDPFVPPGQAIAMTPPSPHWPLFSGPPLGQP